MSLQDVSPSLLPPAIRHSKFRAAAIFIIETAVIGIGLPLALCDTAYGDSDDHHIVHIGGASMEPLTVDVRPGTTVMWKNDGARPVRVRLDRPVSTLCRDPKSFSDSPRGLRESAPLPGGDVATVCFLEENDYPFEVEQLGGDVLEASALLRGTIHVKRTVH